MKATPIAASSQGPVAISKSFVLPRSLSSTIVCLPMERMTVATRLGVKPIRMLLLLTAVLHLMLCLPSPICVGAVTAGSHHIRNAKAKSTTKHSPLRQERALASNQPEVIDDLHIIIRRLVPRFQLELHPTPQQLDRQDESQLIGIMENVLTSFVRSKSQVYPDTSLDYLLLAGVELDDLDTTTNTSVLTFKGGVAYFRGNGAPTTSQVISWVQEAIEQQLPTALQATPYYYVHSATFISTATDAPTSTPIPQQNDGSQKIQQYKSDGSSTPKGVISGSVVGGVAIIAFALLAMFLIRKKQRSERDIRLDEPSSPKRGAHTTTNKGDSVSSVASPMGSDVTHVQPPPPSSPQQQQQRPSSPQQQQRPSSPQQQQQQQRPSSPQQLLLLPSSTLLPVILEPLEGSADTDDDDGSSFTASTRTDHSNLLPPTSASFAAKSPFVATESFQRDRPMAIRKDMLDSTWNRCPSPSGNRSPERQSMIVNDTVLQPSHFSASTERRRRRKEIREEQDEEEEEWYFSERKEEVGEDGFRFESADGGSEGEEVFLMPPTTVVKNRTTPPSPPSPSHDLV